MRILLIDATAKKKIHWLKDHAEKNQFSLEDLKAIAQGRTLAAGDTGFSIELVDGFKVVYSIEHHPSGRFRHISISVNGPGCLMWRPYPRSSKSLTSSIRWRNAMFAWKNL